MKSCSGTTDRSRASVIRIVIRQTLYAVRGVCPRYTPSNMVRKRRLFTAVCGRALQVRSRHPGYLAALRDGRLHVTRLDHIHLPLRILATRLYGEGANTVYEFILSAAAVLVAEGRVTIVQRA